MLGKQSVASRKIAMRDADIREFEESQMIRLTMGKKEKKERKRMMREEMSNLGAISGGLGGVAAGMDGMFGGGDVDGGSRSRGFGGNGGDSSFSKRKGMRKREMDILDHERPRSKKKKRGAVNVYQKSLYGVRGDGGKSKKKKK